MVFTELLLTQGLSEKQIKILTKEMLRNRIFITKEEKIEERYRKMKLQRDQLKAKLNQTEAVLRELDRVLKMELEYGQSKTETNNEIRIYEGEVKK